MTSGMGGAKRESIGPHGVTEKVGWTFHEQGKREKMQIKSEENIN